MAIRISLLIGRTCKLATTSKEGKLYILDNTKRAKQKLGPFYSRHMHKHMWALNCSHQCAQHRRFPRLPLKADVLYLINIRISRSLIDSSIGKYTTFSFSCTAAVSLNDHFYFIKSFNTHRWKQEANPDCTCNDGYPQDQFLTVKIVAYYEGTHCLISGHPRHQRHQRWNIKHRYRTLFNPRKNRLKIPIKKAPSRFDNILPIPARKQNQ